MSDIGISILFVIIVLLFGLGIHNTYTWARKASWADISVARKFSLSIGWVTLAIATIIWMLMMLAAINGLTAAFRPNEPKPHTLFFLFIGTLVYWFLISISNAAVRSSSGSAREDIYRMIGRDP